MTTDSHSNTDAIAKPVAADGATGQSLFGWIGSLFRMRSDGEWFSPTSAPVALTRKVRIGWNDQPFNLVLGDVALEAHRDLAMNGNVSEGFREWIIYAGRPVDEAVPRFIRIKPGASIVLGRTDDLQSDILGFDKSVADRHVRLSNHKGDLTVHPLERERQTCISAIEGSMSPWEMRRDNLLRIPNVLGHSLAPLDSDAALDAIRKVNAIIDAEAYREPDDDGAPGGIIRFPDDMTVIVLGDVHTRAENILRALSEGGILNALERNEACLVFLGDLVHSQRSAVNSKTWSHRCSFWTCFACSNAASRKTFSMYMVTMRVSHPMSARAASRRACCCESI